MRGHLKVVELLFDHSANFQEQDKNGATAIHYVMACNAEAELIEKLVKTYGMSAFTKVSSFILIQGLSLRQSTEITKYLF